MAEDEKRSGAHLKTSFEEAVESAPISRRALLACGTVGVVALGLSALAGCRGGLAGNASGESSDAAETDETTTTGLAHQSVVEDDEGVYFVDLATGSVKRTDRAGSASETLYTNGQPTNSGIRYLVCHDGTICFGDVPSAKILSVPTSGGDAEEVWESEESTEVPVPLLVDDDRLYFGVYDSTTEGSTLRSVKLSGNGAKEHLTIPSGFYFQDIDLDAGRVYYSGINDEDHREIRSATLDGEDELVVFGVEDASSNSSQISWRLLGGSVYVEVQDNENISNRLLRVSTDGTEQELVYDFSSQKMLFDACGDDFFFLDRDAFTLLALDEDSSGVTTLAQIPKATDGTVASILEAGDGVAYVTTTTAAADGTSEYATYLVDRESCEVVELS